MNQATKCPVSTASASAAISPPKLPLPDTILAGRYQLQRILGVGGMGIVYQARDLLFASLTMPCADVAIKVLNSEVSQYQDGQWLLFNEHLQGSRLAHPNIVASKHVAFCPQSQRCFLVMPLIKGELLALQLDHPTSPLTLHQRTQYALSLIAAVLHCHQHGVIHGDIKPANILLCDTGKLKLFDFSISRSLDPQQNQYALDVSKVQAWSGQYVAPEVADGSLPSLQSDTYSLALVLRRLIYLTPPQQPYHRPAITRRRHFNWSKRTQSTSLNRQQILDKIAPLLQRGFTPQASQRQLDYSVLIGLLKQLRRVSQGDNP